MPKVYSCLIEVRGYELDSFNHVNHSVYLNYLEFARWKMLHAEEITLEKLQAWKLWPVIAKIEIQYLKPTFMGDQLEVRTQILEHSKTSFVIKQDIYKGDMHVVDAKVLSVTVNEKGRPAANPPEVSRLWT